MLKAIEKFRLAHEEKYNRGWGNAKYNPFDTKHFEVLQGKKYIKLVCDKSVHCFIVNTDTDKQFKYGDILKPASWNAPAKNFARGNIFAEYHISVYGF